MTRHTWLSPLSGYSMTAVDVDEEKRRRARIFSRAAWHSIAHSISNIISRTRASRDSMSSFAVASVPLAAITQAIV